MWFEKIEFDRNPFEVDPLKSDIKMIGNEEVKKEILYRAYSGSMVFVEGKVGTGKTVLLKYIIDNFRDRGKVIYLDCEKLDREADIEKVLIGKNGLFGRLLKKYPKGMILLIDDVELSSPKNTERIKYFFDQDYLKSVIFTGDSFKNVKLSPSIKDRIGKHIIQLEELSEEEAIGLVNDRLKGKNIMPVEIIKRLYKESRKNPKTFLENCEKICVSALTNGEYMVTENHFKELFSNKKDGESSKVERKEGDIQKKLEVKEEVAKKKQTRSKESTKEVKKEDKKKVEVEYSSSIKIGGEERNEWKENEEELEDELKKELEGENAAEKYY